MNEDDLKNGFHSPFSHFSLIESEVGIYKRKHDSKKTRKQELDQESFFFFSWPLSWSSSCFLVFLIAFLVEFLLSYFLVFFYKFQPLSRSRRAIPNDYWTAETVEDYMRCKVINFPIGVQNEAMRRDAFRLACRERVKGTVVMEDILYKTGIPKKIRIFLL